MANIRVLNSQLNNDTTQVINKLIDMDINAGVAFKLMRIIKELSSILEDKIKMEKKIIDKWTQKDEAGNPVKPKDEAGNEIQGSIQISDVSAFNIEMSEFLNMSNEIAYEKIKFEDLKLETAKVTDLIKLDFLFE